MEKTEIFYDSLESSEYDSLENLLQEGFSNKNIVNTDCGSNTTLYDDTIPFYDKELTKSQVDLCRKNSKSSTIVNKGSCRKSQTRKKTTLSTKQKLSSKSYLDLFYAKIGVENSDIGSSKATCVNMSPRSYGSYGSDDIGSIHLRTDNHSDSR